MARPTGLEPVTYDLEGRCSIQLSYGRANKTPVKDVLEKSSPDVCVAHHLYLVNRSGEVNSFYTVFRNGDRLCRGGRNGLVQTPPQYTSLYESSGECPMGQTYPTAADVVRWRSRSMAMGNGSWLILSSDNAVETDSLSMGGMARRDRLPTTTILFSRDMLRSVIQGFCVEKPEGHANQSGVRLFNLLPLAVRGLRILPAATGGGPSAKITQFP